VLSRAGDWARSCKSTHLLSGALYFPQPKAACPKLSLRASTGGGELSSLYDSCVHTDLSARPPCTAAPTLSFTAAAARMLVVFEGNREQPAGRRSGEQPSWRPKEGAHLAAVLDETQVAALYEEDEGSGDDLQQQ
jgi:hypothetical protein